MLTKCDYLGVGSIDQLPDFLIGQVVGHHGYPIDWPPHQRFAKTPFILIAMIGISDKYIVMVLVGDVLDSAGNEVVERIRDVGNHDGNHVRELSTQTAGREVGVIAKLRNCRHDLLMGVLTDGQRSWDVAEYARNGTLRDAGQFSHISHRHYFASLRAVPFHFKMLQKDEIDCSQSN